MGTQFRGPRQGENGRNFHAKDETEAQIRSLKTLGCQGENQFHPPAGRLIQEERRHHCPVACFQTSIPQRARFRDADARLLHQSGGPWPQREPQGRTAESQRNFVRAYKAGQIRNESSITAHGFGPGLTASNQFAYQNYSMENLAAGFYAGPHVE